MPELMKRRGGRQRAFFTDGAREPTSVSRYRGDLCAGGSKRSGSCGGAGGVCRVGTTFRGPLTYPRRSVFPADQAAAQAGGAGDGGGAAPLAESGHCAALIGPPAMLASLLYPAHRGAYFQQCLAPPVAALAPAHLLSRSLPFNTTRSSRALTSLISASSSLSDFQSLCWLAD